MVIHKAEKYRDNALTKELQDTPYPMCDETCGEVCIEDYMSGYNQAIEDSLCSEMLEILQETTEVIKWYMENSTSDLSEPFFNIGANQIEQIEQLIKQTTEI